MPEQHIRASILKNIANPFQELLNPIQFFNNRLRTVNIKMIIGYSRVVLPIRKIKGRNGWLPSLLNLIENILPLILGGPNGVPPSSSNLVNPIGPHLLQILLGPVLGVLGEVEGLFVVEELGVLLLVDALHELAVEDLREVAVVDFRIVFRWREGLVRPAEAEGLAEVLVLLVFFVVVGVGVVLRVGGIGGGGGIGVSLLVGRGGRRRVLLFVRHFEERVSEDGIR